MDDVLHKKSAAQKQLPVCRMITKFSQDYGQELQEKAVSSRTIIRSSEQNVPAAVIDFEQETNIKDLPTMCYKTSISGSFTDAPLRKRSIVDYSSFLMAHKYPETVGKVDVISDAEHIKKLLKVPFSSDSELSMAVHRIDKTLFLSDFDVPSLMDHPSVKGCGGLDWLRDFYYETSGASVRTPLTSEDSNREQVLLQPSQSSCLEHSAGSNEDQSCINLKVDNLSLESPQPVGELDKTFLSKVLSPSGVQSNMTNQPRPEQSFQRDVLWNFEDLTMLVGSNMPIFGGGKYPVVSLRLRDASTPINVLTGLDYWLDNLMCNVPEVVMCFHVKGIVKKYEIVKTEDLPNMEGGKFSPKVIKDIAQNILSFLRANCTKEGHTYWLFKGSKDDVVKLYDLTTLCSERTNDTSQNPFTAAVGSLLYRVARNMLNSGETSDENTSTIKTLLCNCLVLLDSKKFPELTRSANLLLADLFLLEDHEVKSVEGAMSSIPKIEEVEQFEEDASVYSEEDSDRYESDVEPSTAELNDSMMRLSKEERYRKVIHHIVQALQASQEHWSSVKSSQLFTEAAQPSLKYNSDTNSPSSASVDTAVLSKESNDNPELAYVDDSSLFIKLAQTYCKLAEINMKNEKYGRSLKFLKIGLFCQANYQKEGDCRPGILVHAKILMFIGDVYLFLARCNDDSRLAHKEEFSTLNPDDQYVVSACEKTADIESELGNADPFAIYEEKLFLLASDFYERSLDLYPDDGDKDVVREVVNVTGRLGNIRNELGVYYMNCAANQIQELGRPQVQVQDLWKKSYSYLDKGIKAFEVVNDKQNIALLYSNIGRLMRHCADGAGNSTKSSPDDERGPHNREEKMYYNKAIEFYQKAFSTLGIRQSSPEIWDKVTDEIAGTYLSMATVMTDYPRHGCLGNEEVTREILSALMKSLQYCEDIYCDENKTARHMQERIGNIYYRIGSLYHRRARNQVVDASNKKCRTLADKHYEKACNYLTPEKFPCDFLRCLIERNCLRIQQAHQQHSFSVTQTLKYTNAAIERLVSEQVKRALDVIIDAVSNETRLAPDSTSNNASDLSSEPLSNVLLSDFNINFRDIKLVLKFLTSQLNDCLLEVLRLQKNKQINKGVLSTVLSAPVAKKMLEIALRSESALDPESKVVKDIPSLVKRCTFISGLLGQLEKVRRDPENTENT